MKSACLIGNALHLPLADCSVDTVITDPPYGLSFMGKHWDRGVPGVAFWTEILRVAKPGAMLLAFGGTRTYHRLACAIEDAGWEIRDCVMWMYSTGFPKSLDISKAIDKANGAEREVVCKSSRGAGNGRVVGLGSERTMDTEFAITAPSTPLAKQWDGWGTALKPSYEPIILAMRPLDGTFAQNAEKWGVAGLNIDGGRIGTDAITVCGDGNVWTAAGRAGLPSIHKEVIGRFPANLILDESAAAELDRASGETSSSSSWRPPDNGGTGNCFLVPHKEGAHRGHSDSGGASRFFYVAKASRAERNVGLEGMPPGKRDESRNADQPSMCGGEGNPYNRGAAPVLNDHPTVKPIELLRYLVRLTSTPTGGIVLDPFMGSGSTGCACAIEGRDFVGVDIEPHYVDIARRRIAYYSDDYEAAAELATPARQTSLLERLGGGD